MLKDYLKFNQNLRKTWILFKIFKTFSEISIWVKNFPKILVWVKISKNVDLGKNLQIFRFWSKFSKNLDLGQNCRKFSIIVKI